MKWITLFWIGFGGAFGSMGRAYISYLLPASFPWATLLVNVLGSFLLGFIVGYDLTGPKMPNTTRDFIVIGFCGGFTTFSTFSYQTLQQLQSNHPMEGVFNIVLTLAGTIIAVYFGIKAGQAI